MGNKPVALFDMDGSLVDYHRRLIDDMWSLASEEERQSLEWAKVKSGELSLYAWEEGSPYIKRRMDLIKTQPGWWRNLPAIRMGFEALRICKNLGFKVEILTKGPRSKPQAWAEKVEWCQERGLYDHHVVTDKTKYAGALLYDDYPPYLLGWLEAHPQGLGIQPIVQGISRIQHDRVLHWTGENCEELISTLESLKICVCSE